jgi:hypothetical protein
VVCLLGLLAAGCGSSPKPKQPSPHANATSLLPMRVCLRHKGYSVSPDSASALATAPSRFDFIAVWNVLNPNGVALAVAISRTVGGATRAATWTREENKRIGKGVVDAPVVRFGRIDVLWTTGPRPRDTKAVYSCVKPSS